LAICGHGSGLKYSASGWRSWWFYWVWKISGRRGSVVCLLPEGLPATRTATPRRKAGLSSFASAFRALSPCRFCTFRVKPGAAEPQSQLCSPRRENLLKERYICNLSKSPKERRKPLVLATSLTLLGTLGGTWHDRWRHRRCGRMRYSTAGHMRHTSSQPPLGSPSGWPGGSPGASPMATASSIWAW
jgi:hypothetical protein